MAAIDPTEEPLYDEDDTEKKAPRATLKLVRVPGDMFGDDEDDSEDDDEMDMLNGLGEASDEDSDEDSEEEEVNGGPSEPKAIKAVADEDAENDDEDMDDVSEDDAEAIAALKKIMKGKGKAKAEESDDEEDDFEDDEDPLELEEIVICTLDPEKVRGETHLSYHDELTHSSELSTNPRLCCWRGRASFLQSHRHTHCTPDWQLCHSHG